MIEIDELIRSKRKTLSVSVNALGKVTVRAPLRATQKEIERFLTTHEQWIAKKKSTAKESGVRLPQDGLVGYKLLLLGDEYELCLHAQTRVVVDGENKRLYLPEKNTEKHLIRWLKDNALRICKQAVEKQSARMGVSPVSVSVTSARSFWGICTAKNELRFSYRLLYVPKAVFEYVIVHELAHIRYKNHSRAFWDEVAKFEPNWKRKTRLSKNARPAYACVLDSVRRNMKERIRQRIFRIVCTLTATASLFAFSGCDGVLSYLDGLLSTSESMTDGDSDTSLWESDSSDDSQEDTSQDDSSQDDTSQEDSSQEDSSQEDSSQDDTSQDDTSQEDDSQSEYEQSGDSSTEDSSQDVTSDTLDFSPAKLTEKYGYQYFAQVQNGANLQAFYREMYNACVSFYNSTRNVSSTTVNYLGGGSATVYEIASVNFGQYDLSSAEAITVWSTAMVEFPEFYWLAHSASQTSTKLNVYIDGEYATYASRVKVQADIQACANECYGYLTDTMSQTEKALTIFDYLLGNMQYAYESDGVTAEDSYWAHNIEGVVLKKGVCESYAKTYDYFCELMGIECITVTGMGGEGANMGGHAWNIVKIDGEWYNVDATWEDAYEKPIRKWMGVPNTEFVTTHIAHTPTTHGNTWLYGLPTLSENRLMPVAVSENDGEITYYPNLDKAFSAMQNADSEYRVDLCPQTTAGIGEGVEIHPYGVTFTTKTLPQTAKLTLTGKYVSLTNKTVVTAQNTITVNSPVTVEYATFQYPIGSSGSGNITKGKNGDKEYVF